MITRNALLAALFGASLLVCAPALTADETVAAPAAPDVAELPEARTVTGHIVDLHHYLTTGSLHTPTADKDLLDMFAPEAPVALVVDDKSLADKLLPGKRVYLIMFGGNDDSVRSVYGDARKMLGQAVAVTGRIYERDGLSAISIIGVHNVPDAHADAGEPANDGQM